MPVIRWLAHVLRSTIFLAVNLAIGAALLVGSAALYQQGDEDAQVFAPILRTIGAIWLFSGAWAWVVRGVLMRPPRTTDKRKPSGAEVARGTAGCVANLAAVAAVWVVVGRVADWAWAGITGPDPGHPARLASNRLLAALSHAAERPDTYAPYVVGGLVGLVVLNAILSAVAGRVTQSRQQARAARQRHRAQGSTPGSSRKDGGRRRRQEGEGLAPSQIQAGAASAAAVAAAHHDAHRSSGAHEDPVLGRLTWSSSDGAWWARRGDAFAVRIEAPGSGPTSRQLDLARAVVQRSFEAQLRASDAARAVAQARGVGLPRFAIVTATVGADADAATPVTLHLRCDADGDHGYAVRSTDGLVSYAPVSR